MDVTVRPLERVELSTAARLLARAFAGDPFIGHFLSSPARLRLALPLFFRSVLHEQLPHGTLTAAAHERRLVGAAAWVAPGLNADGEAPRLQARLNLAAVRSLFPRATPRLLDGFAELAHQHPGDPHWYLAFVGVEPGLQRGGVGRQLLAPTLERADADGLPCYLETPFPETRAFYRRLGFEETSELRPVAGAPPIWTMTRRPRASG